MGYYTAKGDAGTAELLCLQKGARISKSESVFETLGALDELNCAIGMCRAVAERTSFSGVKKGKSGILRTLLSVQEDLFALQAEIAGADLRFPSGKVRKMEDDIKSLSKKFPRVSSFVIPGATELGALIDIVRTLARRAERLYARQKREKQGRAADNPAVGACLNRLSSLLYVLARYANRAQGVSEKSPSYK